MNVWVEYFKYYDDRNNNHAQMKEKAKWIPPDPKKIQRRFFPNVEEARKFVSRLSEQGFHSKIKQDGIV